MKIICVVYNSIDRPDDYENNEDGGGVFIDGRSRGLSPTGF
jgi:hypothetical protein